MTGTIESMTGFGSAECRGFRVEVRSLNHRYMDVSIRLPSALASRETGMRRALAERFDRGKFDVYVSAPPGGTLRVRINREAAREVHAALKGLRDELGLASEIDIHALLAWKDLFMAEEVAYDTDALDEAFDGALAALSEMRRHEGRALVAEIDAMAGRMLAMHAEIAEWSGDSAARARERFKARMGALLQNIPPDDTRIVQEAALVAERMDIGEELSRIGHHVAHISGMMGEGGSIGRKLDFLLQELNRETNTIASKSDDHRVTVRVIEMKAEIERMREQAQNIQ